MTTSTILIILIIIVLLAIGGGLIVLIAYGMGWLIHLVTKFDLFQSTLLGLAGTFAFGILAERIFLAITSITRNDLGGEEFEDYYEDDFDDEFEDDFKEDEEEPSDAYPGIPRWRQPLKQIDFSKARPNDQCPCGSGRKFKHCHGAKRPTS